MRERTRCLPGVFMAAVLLAEESMAVMTLGNQEMSPKLFLPNKASDLIIYEPRSVVPDFTEYVSVNEDASMSEHFFWIAAIRIALL